jgi:hypothetical protein
MKSGSAMCLDSYSTQEDDAGRPRAVFKEAEHPAQTFDRIVYALI